MIINHNLASMNTTSNLNSSINETAKSLEKLSSGLRINRAGDDSAGLAISEKMRGQIRGLSQATRNIQDGISLVQVADNGLSQITEQLQRARELSVQAANGTLTSEDRYNLQNEMDQLVKGIDDVANNTEFNTRKLLNPTEVAAPSVTTVATKSEVDIVFVVDNTASMSGLQTSMANNISSMLDKMGTADVRLGLVSYDEINGIRQFDFSTNMWSPSGGSPAVEWTQDVAPVSSALTHLANSGGTENAMHAIGTVATAYDFRKNATGTQTKHIILLTNEDADDEVSNAPDPVLMSQLTTAGIRVHTVYDPSSTDGDNADDIKGLSTGTGGTTVDIKNSLWGSQLTSILGTAISESVGDGVPEIEDIPMPTLLLQVGANANQNFKVELFDARAKAIGIDPLVIDPSTEAEKSISKVDAAIAIISGQRGKFGGYQNALQHIASNVINMEENLTTGESRIRDVDMAKEMTTYKKNDILSQSAQAMLAQANQQSQGVLQLLR